MRFKVIKNYEHSEHCIVEAESAEEAHRLSYDEDFEISDDEELIETLVEDLPDIEQ
jgi:hypothetical protein